MGNFAKDRSTGQAVGLTLTALGALVALVGVVLVVRTCLFIGKANKAPGQIIVMERSHSSEGSVAYYPVFNFTDLSGTVQTQRSSYGSALFSFEPGQRVTILFDAKEPSHAKIDSFWTVWFGPVLTVGLGTLISGSSLFWLSLWTWATSSKNVGDAPNISSEP